MCRVLSLSYIGIDNGYAIIKITFTGLTPPHFCVRPKPTHGLLTLYVFLS
jgi:hypothetical protein